MDAPTGDNRVCGILSDDRCRSRPPNEPLQRTGARVARTSAAERIVRHTDEGLSRSGWRPLTASTRAGDRADAILASPARRDARAASRVDTFAPAAKRAQALKTAIDFSVLLDVLGADARFGEKSGEALRAAYDSSALVACEARLLLSIHLSPWWLRWRRER